MITVRQSLEVMILAKKIKILGELHGGVCIAVVCHKSAKNVILKVKKIYVKVFLNFCQNIPCAFGTSIHFLEKKRKVEKILNVYG
jgi:uncharacterized membrane protein